MKSCQRLLTLQTPGIRAGGIGIITPEEAYLFAAIHRHGDVFANQANSLLAVHDTFGLRLLVTHDH